MQFWLRSGAAAVALGMGRNVRRSRYRAVKEVFMTQASQKPNWILASAEAPISVADNSGLNAGQLWIIPVGK